MMNETDSHSGKVGSAEGTVRGHLTQLTLPAGWKQLADKQIATIIFGVDEEHLPDLMCLSSRRPTLDEDTTQEGAADASKDAPEESAPAERFFVPARCLVETYPVSEEDAREWGRYTVQRIEAALPFAYIMDIAEGVDAQNNPTALILAHFIVDDQSYSAVVHSWTEKVSREGATLNIGATMLLQCRSYEYAAYEKDFKSMIASCHFLGEEEK